MIILFHDYTFGVKLACIQRRHRGLPTYLLVLLPQTFALGPVRVTDYPLTVSFVVFPLACVRLPVLPTITPVPVFHVLLVLPFIGLTGWPGINPSSMHAAFHPISFIDPIIVSLQSSLALKQIILPGTLVYISIGHCISPVSFLYAIPILSFIMTAILPSFLPLAMRLIFSPVPFILLPFFIDEHSVAMGPIIDPVSFIAIPLLIMKFSVAPSLVFPPFPFVLGPVSPNLSAFALSHIIPDEPVIDGSVSEPNDFLPRGRRRIQVVNFFYDSRIELGKPRICKRAVFQSVFRGRDSEGSVLGVVIGLDDADFVSEGVCCHIATIFASIAHQKQQTLFLKGIK